MNENHLVELSDVAIGYRGTPLMTGINLDIVAGDFVGLVGPNGAGKTTLLKAILGLHPPLWGQVDIKEQLHVGYVPQRTRLDPIYPLTALEVVRAGGMGLSSPFKPSTAKEALEALGTVGLTHLAKSPMRDLSGGQQQRVLIARALVRHPKILVLDEPTAGMDLPSEHQLLDLVSDLSITRGLTVILVVHQLSLVAGRVSKLAIINKEKSLFAAGPAEKLLDTTVLSELYGHPMEILGTGENMVVRALCDRSEGEKP